MTQVNTEKLIAETEDAAREDGRMTYGTEMIATATGIEARSEYEVATASGGVFAGRDVAAPWPAVLEHAPTAELVAALKGREGVEVEELSDNWHEFNITVPTTAIFVERRP